MLKHIRPAWMTEPVLIKDGSRQGHSEQAAASVGVWWRLKAASSAARAVAGANGSRTETTVTVSSLPSLNSAFRSLASLSASSVPVGSFRSSFVLPLSSIREHCAQGSQKRLSVMLRRRTDACQPRQVMPPAGVTTVRVRRSSNAAATRCHCYVECAARDEGPQPSA